jgi:hypothetical protein
MISQYNVTISIFRNRVWEQEFHIYDESGSPIDISNDALALVVFANAPVGATPIITNTAPQVSLNVATFTTQDADTGRLTAGNPYTWQTLRRPAGSPSGSGSVVVVSGALNVFDSPPFPT